MDNVLICVPEFVKLTPALTQNFVPTEQHKVFKSGNMIQRTMFYLQPSWDPIEQEQIDGFKKFVLENYPNTSQIPDDFPE